jgi:glycosyltransferase involved in cell wall biosynthesis
VRRGTQKVVAYRKFAPSILPKRFMEVLFLDQTGKIAGAELVLLDVATFYQDNCLVGLFEDGPFRDRLKQAGIPVQVLAKTPIQVQRGSNFTQGVNGLRQLFPLICTVARLSQDYDLIYANTLKALVVGALASLLSRRPLIFHLHDILTKEHFSEVNCRLVVTLSNRFAAKVITVSEAARKAFIAAGGRSDLIQVVYNGFDPKYYQGYETKAAQLRQELELNNYFVVGHFSRLSPWKGQHILIEALTHCPDGVMAVLVGDALFGEQDYVQKLHAQVNSLGLQKRVKFLGFRSDVPQLMAACDLVAHTSTSPEPCARVLVETMLSGRPLVATQDGGTIELVDNEKTGWLVPPGDPRKLAEIIMLCRDQPERAAAIAKQAQIEASQRFHIDNFQQQINGLLQQVIRVS